MLISLLKKYIYLFNLVLVFSSCHNQENRNTNFTETQSDIVIESVKLKPIEYNDEIVRNMDYAINGMYRRLNSASSLVKNYAKELPVEEQIIEFEKNIEISLPWLNIRLKNLRKLEEIDTEIGYKATVFESLENFIDISNNQLSTIPQLLVNDINEKNMIESSELIIEIWSLLVEQEKKCQLKCYEFADKHQFKLNGNSKDWKKEMKEIENAKIEYNQLIKLFQAKNSSSN